MNSPLKIIVLGDTNVGKTTFLSSIITNYKDCKKSDDEKVIKNIDILLYKFKFNEEEYRIKFIICSGKEEFKISNSAFFLGVDGIIILYDLTNENSFNNIKKWIKYANNCLQKYIFNDNDADTLLQIPFIIIGNKYDLIEDNDLNFLKYKNHIIQKYNESFIVCSSKTNMKNFESIHALNLLISKIMQFTILENKYENKKDIIDLQENIDKDNCACIS